jgi:Homeodomain-like domain
MTLALLGNTLLRTAITRNLVTFPAQIQPFMKRTAGDLPERIVQLYFVRGWSVRNICDRYGMSKAMVHKLLAEWRIRAVESGYIQEIEPDCLAVLEPEMNAVPSGAPNRTSADKWIPDVIEAPHAIPEPLEIVYGTPAPMQVPDRAVALSAAGRA